MINRRTLLKGLAAASICGGAESLGSFATTPDTPPKNVTLNLILHGLFVLQFTQDGMQLITPYVPTHRYLASSWDLNDLNPLCPESQPFALTGIKKLKPYDPTKIPRNLLLSKKKLGFDVDEDHAYITIPLPWPQDIKLLRYASPDKKSAKHNIFKNPPLNTVTELALCQVLIYPVDNFKNLALAGTDHVKKQTYAVWRPKKVDPQWNTVNLHLWAEPDKEHNLPSHAVEAYSRLGELLSPLSFALETADIKADRDNDTGVKGMPSVQEMALSEWVKHGEGSSGSNCGCVMVHEDN